MIENWGGNDVDVLSCQEAITIIRLDIRRKEEKQEEYMNSNGDKCFWTPLKFLHCLRYYHKIFSCQKIHGLDM